MFLFLFWLEVVFGRFGQYINRRISVCYLSPFFNVSLSLSGGGGRVGWFFEPANNKLNSKLNPVIFIYFDNTTM